MTARVSCPMTRLAATSLLTLALAAGAVSTSGCATYKPGGDGVSRDAFTYTSTSHAPKSLQLKDTRTGEVLWTYEIPVERELVVRFYQGRNRDNIEMPDEMRWEEWEKGRQHGSLENKMPVPEAEYRRIDVTVRKPEPSPGRAASAE
ncbi:MAG TPA: hypothetical protein VK176_14060 [Phycisphaerales bacterium]|nr:hypothetical protein [Phycisphaerales bacterium]